MDTKSHFETLFFPICENIASSYLIKKGILIDNNVLTLFLFFILGLGHSFISY